MGGQGLPARELPSVGLSTWESGISATARKPGSSWAVLMPGLPPHGASPVPALHSGLAEEAASRFPM